MSLTTTGVSSVIVTYNPDLRKLGRVISALNGDVDSLILVDNASKNQSQIRHITQTHVNRTHLIFNTWNKGFVMALNQGLRECFDSGAGFALILTQDTVLPSQAVPEMLKFYNEHKEMKIGVISAQLRLDGEQIPITDGYSLESMVMSTGILVPRTVFQRIGLYRGNFFMYHEDDEFCFRVRSAGYNIVRLNYIQGSHSEGDARVRVIIPARWRRESDPWQRFSPVRVRLTTAPARKPLMLYYIARNGLYIALNEDRSFLPNFVLVTITNLISCLAYYKQPLSSVGFIVAGVAHALCGRLGKLDC
ncbi:MAG TPA: glycosyltransferase [Nitrososphaerales archaeon]|nr:glycosyltransferase [Nitrososphaerales archaeon]